MKNTSYFKHFSLSILLASGFSTMAQKTVVTDTKTDQTFANTTQVFKSEKATDSQVLAEIEGNFGIGDVVRIAVAPPPTKTVPPPPLAATKPTINGKNPNIAVVTTPTQQKRTIVYIELDSKPNVVKTAEPQRVTTLTQQSTTAVNTPTNATPNVVKTVETQGVTTPSVNEVNLANENKERASTQNNVKQIERRSTKSERTSSSAKARSSNKSSRKSSFSLFSNLSFKSSKSSKFKGGSKFGCYRF
jgi:hypothetical protein